MWRGVSVMQGCGCGDRQLLNDLPQKSHCQCVTVLLWVINNTLITRSNTV